MKNKFSKKNITIAAALGLCLAAPLTTLTPAQAAPERGGGPVRTAAPARSFSGGRTTVTTRTTITNRAGGEGNFRGSRPAPVIARGGGYGGNWHGGDRAGIGLSINLGGPGYYAPGYYAAPAYVAPAGVYVRFDGTVQGVDIQNGFLGVQADNGNHFDVQAGANAANFSPGERVFVKGTAFGSNVQPSAIRPF